MKKRANQRPSPRHSTEWKIYIATPIVVAVIVVGLWLAVAAAYENYRFGRATDQLIAAVGLARDIHISPRISTVDAYKLIINAYTSSKEIDIVHLSRNFLGAQGELGFVNPWGGSVQVYAHPSYQAVHFETEVSSTACRRLLLWFSKDASSLGLRRVDVLDNPKGQWRLVYEGLSKEKDKTLKSDGIYVGCGDSNQVLLSLTFSLNE